MSTTASAIRRPNRWAVLALLGIAQLMVVLDATIVNIALPSAQRALHFSADNRQWVITAYALAFGSLLLLGGKLGDLFGRKWTLIGGLTGFAVASAIGGLSQSFGMLVAARALMGILLLLVAAGVVTALRERLESRQRELEALAVRDPLTGVGNYRLLTERLDYEITRHRRSVHTRMSCYGRPAIRRRRLPRCAAMRWSDFSTFGPLTIS